MSEQPLDPRSPEPRCCTPDFREQVEGAPLPPDQQHAGFPTFSEYYPDSQSEWLPATRPLSPSLNDLDPPFYAGPVLDVEDADIGVGIRHVDPYLLVTFVRWTALSVGDTFEYYHGNSSAPLAFDFVRNEQQADPFFYLAIERERVPEGFSFPTYGRVVRNGSGTPSTSNQLTVFVKSVRPGLDEQPGLGYHDKLLLSLPADLAAPGAVLTPQRAALGVVITLDYPGKRVRDKVYLYWDTIAQLVVFELDEDHASGAKPIQVTVPPGVIGTGSGLIPIRYQVFDEVQNRSGHVEHFSQAVLLQAELDPNLLRRPRFLVNGVSVTSVNYDQDAGKSFAVQVVTPDTLPDGRFIPPGARLVVMLRGMRVDETAFELDLPDQLADPGWPSSFRVDEATIKDVIQGTLRIIWRIEFPLGTVLASSQSLTILVTGTIASMPAVNVVEAEAGLVDPAAPFITIEYPTYSPYDPNYLVTLRLEALLPGGGVVEYVQQHIAGAPPPPTRFRTVSQANFARFIGLGDVRVFYKVDDGLISVLNAGVQTVRESESTLVQFGDRVPEMPRPEIDRVVDDNLDPDDLFGQLDITLPYSRTFSGDRFEWRLVGTAADGSTNGFITLNSATAGRPVTFSLDRHYADTNVSGEIRLSYSLIPASAGRTLRSEILVVTVGKALGDLLRPEVLEASKSPDQLAPEAATAGATIRVSFPQMLPSDDIRACWTGIPGIGSHCETKSGNSHKTVDFTVPSEVLGACIAPSGQPITVQYFLLRGSREIPSLPLELLLLNLTTVPIPTIEGIGDMPLLDLSRLNGTERTMINTWHFIHRDQRMWMEYRGTYADPEGEYFEATYTNNLVTVDGENNGILPPTPVDELRKLKDGSELTIRFWVSFNRGSNKANAVLFRERHYRVQALPRILPHPRINGTPDMGPDVTIDPLPIEHNTSVTVSYPGMSGTTDRITLKWFFEDGTVHETNLNGQDGGTVVFNLTTAQVLHRSVDRTVQLSYSVARTGVTDPIPSEVQTVRVNTIPLASLPRALINGLADGETLNLDTFVGDALAALEKWPLSRTGQRVWLTCSSSGVADLPVLNGVAITSTEAANGLVNKAVMRSWLAALANGAWITVTCEVTFDGSTNRSRAVMFRSTRYTLVYLPLQIDQTTMILNGRAVIALDWPKKGEYPGNTQTRVARGGRPPYRYQSRNSAVASVTSAGGFVAGMRNGSTFIDVTDNANNTVSYLVTVSNVLQLRENRSFMGFSAAMAWRNSIPNSQHHHSVAFMETAYGPPTEWPLVPGSAYWLCQDGGCDALTRPE